VSKEPQAGNLDGIRGKPVVADSYASEMYEAIQSLRGMGINDELVRDVVVAEQLIEALDEDTLMKRLFSDCQERLIAAQNAWSGCFDPSSAEMRSVHTEARAAQMLIDWIGEILTAGAKAEQEIAEEENFNE